MKEIPITIKETHGITRINEPVTLGLPMPGSALRKNNNGLAIRDNENKMIPVQVLPLALWPDESYKWILIDFQASVDAYGTSEYTLISDSTEPSVSAGIEIKKEDKHWIVDTGAAVFYLDNKIFAPLKRVVIKGIDVIEVSRSKVVLLDKNIVGHMPRVRKIEVENNGFLRTTFKISGQFEGNSKKSLQFIARVHFYADQSFVRIDFTLSNTGAAKHPEGLWDLGDPGSVLFSALSLEIAPKSDSRKTIKYSLESGNKILSISDGELIIYQDSSGGKNWMSLNHINRHGKVAHRFKGYEVKHDGKLIKSGMRAEPLIYLGDKKVGISGTIYQFWQNFPKALEVNDECLRIGLFPGCFNDLYELQGGEQKTHTIYLDFSNIPDRLNWSQYPLRPMSIPEYYADTKVFSCLADNKGYRNRKYEEMIETAIKGNNNFFNRREVIDEYGWRNFGEVYADHEAVKHSGPSPLISHYNNQYDLIYGAIQQFLMKSDRSWFELMNDLARHVIDIDIYHTKHDRKEFNGGLFWHTNHYLDTATCGHRSFSKEHLKYFDSNNYGGGPGLEHNYTTGLLHHYYLTGDNASKEAVLGLARWVLNVIDEPTTFLGVMYGLKKKLPLFKKVLSGGRIKDEKFPFSRASGNSINALIDVYYLSGEREYLLRVEEIIRGCIHPADNIENRDLLNAEIKWSYTVCLQAVGRFLDVKAECGQLDDMYCYARDSLLHYAKWMLEYEYPYLEKPEILEFPTETWAAQDLRKCCVFYYAAKCSSGSLQNTFLEKAEYFFNYSIDKLYTFEARCLTRPIVLLLQNAGMHFYFQKNKNYQYPSIADKKVSCNEKELLTLGQMFKQAIFEMWQAIKISSFIDEIKWLKCRLNRHV